ncbi:MAG: hypothetical protein GC159_04485 [Phycisphaera sp.]|nr:hypothetical protein [Phycisphaera sp.]
MQPHRISAKLFVDNHEAVDLHKVIPVFHRWIRDAAAPGLLIDVADYTHVPQGPGVVLIGHDRDYAIDVTGDRPGMQCVRKRIAEGNLVERIRATVHGALKGAAEFERDASPHGPLTFRTDELLVQILDRLEAPNTAETFEQVKAATAELFGELYEGGDVSVDRGSDDLRDPLTLKVNVTGAADLATLITRLETAGATA